jgi:glycosyltransferase involved in cell wall biosynthesis
MDLVVLQVFDKRSIFQRIISRSKQFFCKAGLWGNRGFYDAAYSISTAKSYCRCWSTIDFSVYHKVISISPRTVAFLPEGIKPILWIDNTLSTYHLYPEMQGISPKSLQEGTSVEKIAFERAEKIVTASAWLKREIINQFPFSAPKTVVVPRGANLPQWPQQEDVDFFYRERMNSATLQLLHVVSGGWPNDRKGSQMVLEVYRLLKKQIPVSLTIIGGIPGPDSAQLAKEEIKCAGRVIKETAAGFEQWKALMGNAHFLFVPSKADGFGIVYTEAAALGIPSLALSVMGVTEAVQQGVTGWLLAAGTDAAGWADFILEKWQDREAYNSLCASTRSHANEYFQWAKNLSKVFG